MFKRPENGITAHLLESVKVDFTNEMVKSGIERADCIFQVELRGVAILISAKDGS
jgi:hypothetical protein